MKQLFYTFSLIMLLLAGFLGIWWTQRYQSALFTLREQVENELNLLISENFMVRTFEIVHNSQFAPGQKNTYRIVPIPTDPLVTMGGRPGKLRQKENQTMIILDNDTHTYLSETRVMIDDAGAFLMELPNFVRDSLTRKFGVKLRQVKHKTSRAIFPDNAFAYAPSVVATAPSNPHPTVRARMVGNSGKRQGTDYYLYHYRSGILLGMAPEFVLGLFLFGATGFAFISAYRNMREQARQLRQKDALVANVAHELKTPIATVGVALEALNVFGISEDPARRQEYLTIGQAELQRLDQMADRAIDTLQAGELGQRLQRVNTDTADIVRQAWRGLALRYQQPETALQLTTDGNAQLMVDPHYWHHLVYNLLDNACKYAGKPLKISVHLRQTATEYQLTVTDNGPGIPPGEQEQIFTRFYRIHRPGEGHTVKGHGLGLSFVREVARAHGGDVSVKNTREGGAAFIVTLRLT